MRLSEHKGGVCGEKMSSVYVTFRTAVKGLWREDQECVCVVVLNIVKDFLERK